MEPGNPLLDDFVLCLAAQADASRASCSFRPPRATRPRRSTPSRRGSPAARACPSISRCSACATSSARWRRSSSTRTSSTSAAARCATCSRSGARTGSTSLLIEAWRSGIVLAGLSAGAMCWFQGGVTRSSGTPDGDHRPGAAGGIADGSRRRRARAAAGLARGRARRQRCPAAGPSTTASGSVPGRAPAACGQLTTGRWRPARGCDRRRARACSPGAGAPRRRRAQRSARVLDEDVRELRRVRRVRRGIAGEERPINDL